VSTVTKAQEIDHAYHADRLLLLIARRGKLPAGSDQIPALDAELISVEDLVRSYRLMRVREHRKIGAGSACSAGSRARGATVYGRRTNLR
jgi:hypothetical protein